MGMYTEVFVVMRVKDDPQVINILSSMCGSESGITSLPAHPFFITSRWDHLFTMTSGYFTGSRFAWLEKGDDDSWWSFVALCDLKNYDNEVEKFFDWVRPYVSNPHGQMIGYSRYEEDREPKIYYASDGTA